MLFAVYGLVKVRDRHSITCSIQAIFFLFIIRTGQNFNVSSIGLSLFCLLPLALSIAGFTQTHPFARGRVGFHTEIRVTVSGVSSESLRNGL